MQLVSILNKVIRYSFYLLFITIPLILTPWNYELFEFNKMLIAYTLTIIIFSAWMIRMAITRTISIRRTPLDIPILLFAASQLVSSLFSIDPHVSWFGYYSRFNGGMLSIITYIILYYALVSNYSAEESDNTPLTKKSLLYLIQTMIGTAILVSFYAILQRLGIDKNLWVQDVQNRVFSTLGQPNWLAAYLSALLPITTALAIIQQLKNKSLKFTPSFLVWTIFSCVIFISILFTKSRSGFIATGIAYGLFISASFLFIETKKRLIQTLAIPLIFFVFAASFIGTGINQIDNLVSFKSWQDRLTTKQSQTTKETAAQQQGGTLLEFGGTESGTIRQYVWQAALTAWRSTPKAFLIGTGTETFAFAFFQYKPLAHNLTSEWDFLYNKAHNEYLNYLTTTGIIGFISYNLIILVCLLWIIYTFTRHIQASRNSKNNQEIDIDKSIWIICIALFSGWISILITNFFGFSVVIMQILLFLFPSLVILLLQKNKKRIHITLHHLPIGVSMGFGFTGLLVGALSLSYITIYWIADKSFADGYRQSRQGLLAQSYKSITQSILLRPSEPMYYDELSVVLSGLSIAAMEAGAATDAATLARESLAASDKALKISPKNVNFWKSRTKIYFGFAQINEDFVKAAIQSLEAAQKLSPLDPKITYNIAVLQGRLGQNETAIELLKKTIALKPNYRDPYFALYVFYLEVKQPSLAKAILEEYLRKVDPNDKDFQERIAQPNPTTLP